MNTSSPGEIRCVCGRTRSGEGPLRGKYLYYRCSDRVSRFPLPTVCKERGINARIGDELVWDKIADLMSSPDLMLSHAERWTNSKQDKTVNSVSDIRPFENELASLNEQLGRHNKAYGAGLFTIEQLREYTQPIKDRMAALDLQISNSKSDSSIGDRPALPQKEELERFADEARDLLHNLSFSQKRAILLDTVDRIVGTPSELHIYGSIPIKNHVEFKTSNRHSLNVPRHAKARTIPFELQIKLPAPLRRGVDYGFLPGTNISERARRPS